MELREAQNIRRTWHRVSNADAAGMRLTTPAVARTVATWHGVSIEAVFTALTTCAEARAREAAKDAAMLERHDIAACMRQSSGPCG